MLLLLPLLASLALLPAVFSIKSIGLIADVPDAEGLGTYNMQAENGCKKAIARVADEYRCYWIFRPASVSPDREAEHFIDEVAKDTTLFHLVTMLGSAGLDVNIKLANRFPQITVSANEMAVSPTDPPNIQGTIYNKYQSIFLAGVAAGAVTKTNNVAIIANFGFLSYFWNMYLRGVLYVNPVATVQYRVAHDNTWSNKTWGQQLAQEEIDGGADVIFGAAGSLGSEGIRYAASKKIWVIGVDQDESHTTFANKSEEASQYIIGSAVFDAERAVESMVAERLAGDLVPGNKQFDVTNGGVRFAQCSSQISCAALNQSFTFIDTSTENVNVQVLTISNLLRLIETRMKVGSLTMPSVRDGIHEPYLLNNGSWSMLHTFGRRPSPLYSHSFTPLQNGYIFAFGGQTDLGDSNWRLDRISLLVLRITVRHFATAHKNWSFLGVQTPSLPFPENCGVILLHPRHGQSYPSLVDPEHVLSKPVQVQKTRFMFSEVKTNPVHSKVTFGLTTFPQKRGRSCQRIQTEQMVHSQV
ncbi:basic membrane protein-domain-containing protein [Chytriomyces cf. hyalinus JEL632]|nr:basic membrane protein-domain-containing protein [Chytriomyces cf. hyalinus JEL632]